MHVAIIGGGQLARMMAQAGQDLGMTFSFLAEEQEDTSPVTGLGNVVVRTKNVLTSNLFDLLGKPQYLTVERESVDADLLEEFSEFCMVAPSAKAIKVLQNRSREKHFIESLAIPTAEFRVSTSTNEVSEAVKQLGYPLLVKAAENGYDGKAQWRLKSVEDLNDFLAEYENQEVIVERLLNFDVEVSIIGARTKSGNLCSYNLTENTHQKGILLHSKTPVHPSYASFENLAKSYLEKLMEELDYVGVMSVECFVVGEQLLINEIAPRVHNSGHWTMTGSNTSQFTNHLLAISEQRLGNSELKEPTYMLNLLGKNVDEKHLIKEVTEYYWYNKKIMPNRKVGHVNLHYPDKEQLDNLLFNLMSEVYK
ncbi:MAG: 5-(carboxyamino)imidazole ribonucleotide synthase [Pseudomonadota bacterium]